MPTISDSHHTLLPPFLCTLDRLRTRIAPRRAARQTSIRRCMSTACDHPMDNDTQMIKKTKHTPPASNASTCCGSVALPLICHPHCAYVAMSKVAHERCGILAAVFADSSPFSVATVKHPLVSLLDTPNSAFKTSKTVHLVLLPLPLVLVTADPHTDASALSFSICRKVPVPRSIQPTSHTRIAFNMVDVLQGGGWFTDSEANALLRLCPVGCALSSKVFAIVVPSSSILKSATSTVLTALPDTRQW